MPGAGFFCFCFFLLEYCKGPACVLLQNKLPSTLQPSLQFVHGRPHLKCNPTWNLTQTNQLEKCQSRRHTLLCSKPIRVEVWHFARGENLPLDELITHHLAVSNVFTTVDPHLGFLQRLSSFSVNLVWKVDNNGLPGWKMNLATVLWYQMWLLALSSWD